MEWMLPLRSQSLRITRERCCLSNIVQTQEEHDDTVQAQTTTGVWSTPLSEGIHVIRKPVRSRIDALVSHRSLQFGGIVYPLSSRHDLLASHEKVVRVGQFRVCRVWLGVEWSHGHGEFVEDVEIGVVLLANDLTKSLLLGRSQISDVVVLLRGVDAGVLEQFDTVKVFQSQRPSVLEVEVTGLGEVFLNNCNLVLVS